MGREARYDVAEHRVFSGYPSLKKKHRQEKETKRKKQNTNHTIRATSFPLKIKQKRRQMEARLKRSPGQRVPEALHGEVRKATDAAVVPSCPAETVRWDMHG